MTSNDKSNLLNIANLVTLARVGLALITLSLACCPDDSLRWWAFALTILVIYADALDGFLARKLKLTSKFGAMLDIAGDRVVEMAYWIVFSALGWIPVWVPLLYLVRGTFVDAVRAEAATKGFTAFGQSTMMSNPIGKFLVASNFSRFSYAVAKAFAFCLVIASHTQLLTNTPVGSAALFCVYFSCLFCLLRGLPVLLEAPSVLK